jgi:hypothetical protein
MQPHNFLVCKKIGAGAPTGAVLSLVNRLGDLYRLIPPGATQTQSPGLRGTESKSSYQAHYLYSWYCRRVQNRLPS